MACGVKQEELTSITVGDQALHRFHILHAAYTSSVFGIGQVFRAAAGSLQFLAAVTGTFQVLTCCVQAIYEPTMPLQCRRRQYTYNCKDTAQ